jgi:tetratricopeptide (TPR) repeat protein
LDHGVAYTDLGNISTELGDYAAARDYYLRALAIRRQAFGEAHPEVAYSLNNLGNVFERLGGYSAARDYFEQALAIKGRI